MNGDLMLLHQSAAAFELWTGLKAAPLDLLRQKLDEGRDGPPPPSADEPRWARQPPPPAAKSRAGARVVRETRATARGRGDAAGA